jgi:hypothetical protein
MIEKVHFIDMQGHTTSGMATTQMIEKRSNASNTDKLKL